MSSSSSTNAQTSVPRRRLLGKVALVTGGASGLGESITRLFHIHGAKICIADLQDNRGKEVCESLGGEANVCFYHCDVTVEDEVRRAVNFTVRKFGTLDILINNEDTFGSPCHDICNVDSSEFERVFNINVKGVFHGMKHAARVMIPKKKGSIISVANVVSVQGDTGPHAYTGSKHAVLGLTKSVAAELGRHGIRVNCVSPYGVLTGSVGHNSEEERNAIAGRNVYLKDVEMIADQVANAVVFLTSDDAKYTRLSVEII